MPSACPSQPRANGSPGSRGRCGSHPQRTRAAALSVDALGSDQDIEVVIRHRAGSQRKAMRRNWRACTRTSDRFVMAKLT
jgi:hypothetical protein